MHACIAHMAQERKTRQHYYLKLTRELLLDADSLFVFGVFVEVGRQSK